MSPPAHTLPRPLLVGRVGRLVVGAFAIWFVVEVARNAPSIIRGGLPDDVMFWIGTAFAFLHLPEIVNIGFNRSWGRRPQLAMFVGAAGAAVVSLAIYRAVWAPPLATLAVLFGLYAFAHLGVSHLLAAVVATPGCEMRALAHARSLFTRRAVQFHACPGLWDPLDRWETERFQGRLKRRRA